jgi:putative membrane protein
MLRNFVIRLVINAVALYLTASILPGITVSSDVGTLLLVALVFGVLNAVIKPIVKVLTCPLTILTLGLFIFVINALMLLLTSALINDPTKFFVDGFGWAVVAGIVMGIIAIFVEFLLDRLGFDED